jgi:hypothetical protein
MGLAYTESKGLREQKNPPKMPFDFWLLFYKVPFSLGYLWKKFCNFPLIKRKSQKNYLNYFITRLNLSKNGTTLIRETVSKYPDINWKDALGSSQVESKLRLVDELAALSDPRISIYLIGGWVGLISFFIKQKRLPFKKVINIDLDQRALKASHDLNSGALFDYISSSSDALNVSYQGLNLVVVNTSCEHLNEYETWISKIPAGTRCFLQSNNMFGVPGHVNCVKSLEEFKIRCGLSEIITSEEIFIGNQWSRYMVIGRR